MRSTDSPMSDYERWAGFTDERGRPNPETDEPEPVMVECGNWRCHVEVDAEMAQRVYGEAFCAACYPDALAAAVEDGDEVLIVLPDIPVLKTGERAA